LSDIDTPHETLLAEAVNVLQEALLSGLKPRGPSIDGWAGDDHGHPADHRLAVKQSCRKPVASRRVRAPVADAAQAARSSPSTLLILIPQDTYGVIRTNRLTTRTAPRLHITAPHLSAHPTRRRREGVAGGRVAGLVAARGPVSVTPADASSPARRPCSGRCTACPSWRVAHQIVAGAAHQVAAGIVRQVAEGTGHQGRAHWLFDMRCSRSCHAARRGRRSAARGRPRQCQTLSEKRLKPLRPGAQTRQLPGSHTGHSPEVRPESARPPRSDYGEQATNPRGE
jgi:hypothetical protein